MRGLRMIELHFARESANRNWQVRSRRAVLPAHGNYRGRQRAR